MFLSIFGLSRFWLQCSVTLIKAAMNFIVPTLITLLSTVAMVIANKRSKAFKGQNNVLILCYD